MWRWTKLRILKSGHQAIDVQDPGVIADLGISLKDLLKESSERTTPDEETDQVEQVCASNEQLICSLTTREGCVTFHKNLWHMNFEDFWRYLKPDLDGLKATKSQIKKCKAELTAAIYNCADCRRANTRLGSHPRVGGVISNKINEWAAIDVTFCKAENKTYAICHMMDIFTKWSLAVARQKAANLKAIEASKVLSLWHTHFGTMPRNLLADNGKEFFGHDFWRTASLSG